MQSRTNPPRSGSGYGSICEREIQDILNAAPQVFFLLKPDGTILLANAALADQLHVPFETIQGMDAFKNDQPEVAEHRRAMVRKAAESGKSVMFVDRQQGRTFENTVSPIPHREGEDVRLAYFVRDITLRTEREIALQKSQQLLNTIEALTHAGGWEWDVEAQTMTWTDETYRIHGYSSNECPQGSADLIQYSLKCYDPEDRPTIETAFRTCIAEGRPYDLVFPFTNAQGRRLWIRTIGVPIRHEGKIVKVIGNIVDITHQKQMENVLQARLRLSEEASTLPFDQLLQSFLDEAETLTESTIGFFHFFESDQQTIHLQTWSSKTLRFCHADGKGLHYHMDKAGVWADCIRQGRPVIHNAYAELPNRKGLPSGHVAVIRELVVPIFREGRIVAVFGVGNKAQDYDERDVEIVSALGDMAWDIVLRRREEDALRESESRFRQIYEHMGIGVARISLDFRIEAANAAYCRMLGYREEELIGMHLRDITHPEVIEENLERQRQLGAGLIDHYSMEKRFIHKDGHTVYGILNANLIRNAEGKPSYFLGSVADITEKKASERLLQEESERWQRLFEQSSDGIVILDETAKVVSANRRFADMLGYAPEEIDGLHAWDWDARFSKEEIQEMARSIDDAGHHFETLHRRKDGTTFPVELSNSRTLYRGQKLIFCIVRDLSDRKAAEAEKLALEARNRQLQKAESLRRMAGAIAHQFNNQLYVVTGNLEMALEDVRKGFDATESIVAALQGARRAAEVLWLMVIYLGQSFEKHKPLDLSEACRQSLIQLESAIPKDIHLETDFLSPGPIVRSDVDQIHRILSNLLVNAWEALSEGRGRIHIAIQTVFAKDIPTSKRFPVDWQPVQDGYACLEVSDTGCGIPEKDIEKLFDPFFSTKFIGRGLGLSVVMGIVKTHGGAITVETELGKGTTLRLFFPLDASNAANPTP